MRNPVVSRTLHRWCWGLAVPAGLMATEGGAALWGWLALILILVGDVLWIRAARPVADPSPMPAAGYILMMLASIVWFLVGVVLLFWVGWLNHRPGEGAAAFWVLAVLLFHLPAWLAASLLAEAPHLRLVRLASLVGMVVVVPLVLRGLASVAGAFPEAPAELLWPAPVLAVLTVFAAVDLLARRGLG